MKKVLLFFLLALPVFLSAQNNLNILRSSIYDFNIGDEFEYSFYVDYPYNPQPVDKYFQYIRKTVSVKSVFTDSVCYEFNVHTVSGSCAHCDYNGQWIYSSTDTTEKQCYGHLGDTLKKQTVCQLDSGQNQCVDCENFDQNGCWGTAAGDSTKATAFFDHDIYFQFQHTSTALSGESFLYETFAEGLGLVKSSYNQFSNGPPAPQITKLVWFKKGSETKGTPLDFSVSTNEIFQEEITYSMKNNSITFSQPVQQINIYNVQGQLVYSLSNDSIIDFESLNAGIYIIQSLDKEELAVIRFIKF